MKKLAKWVVCPGVENEGETGHSMRDFCSSCAPWWGHYPTCPVHGNKLHESGYCKFCKKYYDVKKK